MDRNEKLILAAADRIILYDETPEKALAHVLVRDTIRRVLDECVYAHFCLCA